MEDRPETLLKSALEKIVYFEARSEQLSNDLAAARQEAQRLREELASASQREIELRRQSAELEVLMVRAHAARDELGRLNDALRGERSELIGKLLEASSIHASDQTQDQDMPFDLARFIAELRSAADRLGPEAPPETAKVAIAVTPVAATPAMTGPSSHAVRLQAEGRLAVSTTQVLELSTHGAPFAGRSEETLFGFSVRELGAPDPSARIRAAERLAALGHSAAAPALATALNAESDSRVIVALLEAFGRFSFPSGLAIVSPQLDSKVPQVRVAALKAMVALCPTQAGPHLAAALKDSDPSVRRRASLLALGLGGEAALQLGEEALRDTDAEVRSLAALVLGASGGEPARALLQGALRDSDRKVRTAAAQSLSRLLGEDLSGVVEMDDAQRRREARRISSLPLRPVHLAKTPIAPLPQAISGPAPVRVAPEKLCAELLAEIRMAIRGRSLADLAATAGSDQRASEACELLAARGQVVKRGAKYFAA